MSIIFTEAAFIISVGRVLREILKLFSSQLNSFFFFCHSTIAYSNPHLTKRRKRWLLKLLLNSPENF